MLSRCDLKKGAAVALLTLSTQGAWAQETKMNLFKIVTIKDLLGHESVHSSERYARVSNRKVKQEYVRTMKKVIRQTKV